MKGQERRYMKKLILLLVPFLMVSHVSAEEVSITYKRLDGIYYNQKINGELRSNMVTMFIMGDRIAYCIEPGVDITEKWYEVSRDWENIEFSSETKNYIEKIGYYGYEYPGHNTDLYYIATQELIWEAIRDDMEITWTTGKNLSGDVIDISKEKNEILSLISKHSLEPSFTGKVFSGLTSSEIVIEDENDVLENYEISNSAYHTVIKDGNTLKITFNSEKVPLETLTLTRTYYDKYPLLVYSKGDSQKLAALRISNDKEVTFSLENEEEVIPVPSTGVASMPIILAMAMTGVGIVLRVKFF